MLRFALAAAALALASAGDQFCFDQSGKPSGRDIADGKSAAILPGRALNEIFPGGTRIVPQPSTLEENNGDGKVPSDCYEGGKIPVKAPYNLKLGQCRGDLTGEELLEVCLALCAPVNKSNFAALLCSPVSLVDSRTGVCAKRTASRRTSTNSGIKTSAVCTAVCRPNVSNSRSGSSVLRSTCRGRPMNSLACSVHRNP